MLIQTNTPHYLPAENIKKRAYQQRIREVEHSTFTPIVLSLTGGLGLIFVTVRRINGTLDIFFYIRIAKGFHLQEFCITLNLPIHYLRSTAMHSVGAKK